MASDISFSIDMRDFGSQIARLAMASRRTNKEVLIQQCRLMAVDLIRSTPPTGTRPLTESFAAQKKKGEMSVDRDITRLFQPLTTIRAVIDPAPRKGHNKPSRLDYLKHLAQHGKFQELSEAMFDMQITDERVPIIAAITTDEYRATWMLFATRGTVSKKRARRTLVWDSSALALVREEVKKHVGWAKGGWNPSARRLQAKRVPAWITSKPSPGGFIDNTNDGDAPSFTFINNVKYIAYLNNGNRLLLRVIRERQRAMEISLEHAIEHFCEEFNNAA
jgi:hypothetical protein